MLLYHVEMGVVSYRDLAMKRVGIELIHDDWPMVISRVTLSNIRGDSRTAKNNHLDWGWFGYSGYGVFHWVYHSKSMFWC